MRWLAALWHSGVTLQLYHCSAERPTASLSHYVCIQTTDIKAGQIIAHIWTPLYPALAHINLWLRGSKAEGGAFKDDISGKMLKDDS